MTRTWAPGPRRMDEWRAIRAELWLSPDLIHVPNMREMYFSDGERGGVSARVVMEWCVHV